MEWRDVVGYPGYKINNCGEVLSIRTGTEKLLNTFLNKKGYVRVGLMKDGKQKQVFVHRLVTEAYIGKIPDGKCVNHIDGNKENNHVSNLEILTHSENIIHSCYVLGKNIKPVLMLDKKTLKPIKKFNSASEAGRAINIDIAAIYKVCVFDRNFAGGYSWCFADEYTSETIQKKRNRLKGA
ncbi:HNH endonuclease [Niallia sp. Krafla_26]|uniref:HNH endonuclease n=1 Tax=Niallia sp. Krafla_26 TaxID=3064703 RepID=UPI003D168F22